MQGRLAEPSERLAAANAQVGSGKSMLSRSASWPQPRQSGHGTRQPERARAPKSWPTSAITCRATQGKRAVPVGGGREVIRPQPKCAFARTNRCRPATQHGGFSMAVRVRGRGCQRSPTDGRSRRPRRGAPKRSARHPTASANRATQAVSTSPPARAASKDCQARSKRRSDSPQVAAEFQVGRGEPARGSGRSRRLYPGRHGAASVTSTTASVVPQIPSKPHPHHSRGCRRIGVRPINAAASAAGRRETVAFFFNLFTSSFGSPSDPLGATIFQVIAIGGHLTPELTCSFKKLRLRVHTMIFQVPTIPPSILSSRFLQSPPSPSPPPPSLRVRLVSGTEANMRCGLMSVFLKPGAVGCVYHRARSICAYLWLC